MVKNLPTVGETWVRSLGWEDPLEEGMATTPVFWPGESPWTEEPGGLQSMGSRRVRYDWVTKHSIAHMSGWPCMKGAPKSTWLQWGVMKFYFQTPCLLQHEAGDSTGWKHLAMRMWQRYFLFTQCQKFSTTMQCSGAQNTGSGQWVVRRRNFFVCVKPLRCGWWSHCSIAWVTLTDAVRA